MSVSDVRSACIEDELCMSHCTHCGSVHKLILDLRINVIRNKEND